MASAIFNSFVFCSMNKSLFFLCSLGEFINLCNYNLYTQTFYCHIERKNWTIFMAEPQNLRFREFQAFFGLEGENSNKNKK